MRTADIVCAAVIACIGVVVILDSIRLGSGWEADGPQAGFFPGLLGSLVVAGCLIIIWHAVRRRGVASSAKPFIKREAIASVLSVVVPAALMVLLTEFIGLYLAAAIYLLAYIRWVGRHRWHTALSIGILAPLVFYVLFDRIFLIPMPQGMLGGYLGF
jgi:putative tricarboxylic transport membrane protein